MNELRDKEEQYNEYLKYTEENNNNGISLGKCLLIISVLCLILAVVSYGTIKYLQNPDADIFSFLHKTENASGKKFNLSLFDRKQNLLLLGVDSNGRGTDPFKGTRSDTIMILNIDPSSKTVNVISVPRDSKVYIANEGVQKINAAHAIGGVDLTKKTIEETLGIKIDKYVVVNNAIVKQLVDTLGGIPVYIEKNMIYHDRTAGLNINLSKGLTILNGEQAEGYIRYRHDGLGDIGRTSRQQWFMRGVLERIQSPAVITKIPDVIKTASTYVKTDLTLYEMSHLAAFFRSVDMSEVEVATLPGAPSKKGYISYWILDPDKTQEVLDRLVYRHKENITDQKLVVGIMYAFNQEEKAMEIKKKLKEAGYDVNCIGRAQLPHSQIIGHNSAVSSDFINWLKKRIPEIRNTQFVYDPTRTYCVKSDFTIIVADS